MAGWLMPLVKEQSMTSALVETLKLVLSLEMDAGLFLMPVPIRLRIFFS